MTAFVPSSRAPKVTRTCVFLFLHEWVEGERNDSEMSETSALFVCRTFCSRSMSAAIVPAVEPGPGIVDDTVIQLVLGLTDPAGFNREIRTPTSGEKTAFFQAQWKSIAGDNFSGFPSFVLMKQDDSLQSDIFLQLPIGSPLNTLMVARMRDLVRCFVIQDKNVYGGVCPMQLYNRIGSTAFRLDLLSGLSAIGEIEYGGASYWPNAFQPPFGAMTGGIWSSNNVLNKVSPAVDNVTTTWQGFNSWRSAHGPVIGAATGRKQYYIFMDGSPWARPNFNLYRSAAVPLPPGRTGIGICGYICQWAGAISLANDLPPPIVELGGQFVTQAWLIAHVLNYDEVFYLTAGCISICVCPQLTFGDPTILPVGVYFSARVFRWDRGAEKIIYQTPVGITLANMHPGDPYCVIPIYEPGEHRVEFSVWLDPTDPQVLTKQGRYTYSIIMNSLTEFLGHHMAPALVSNNLNTLLDGNIARVDTRPGSTQENIADVNSAAPDGSALNLAASSTTVKAAIVLASELSIYDNTGNNNDGGSIITAQLPTGTDWRDVMQKPRYADNFPSPPAAFQTTGLATPGYCDPAQNLALLSKHPIELRISGIYKSFHPLGGRKELELIKSITACRLGQIRANVPNATIVSQFALDYPLSLPRSTVTVISASPNAGWFAPANQQAQALIGSSPLDYRLQVDISGEYTSDNMWKGSSLRTSLTTWSQMEVAAYIIGQLDFAAIGNDPIRTTYRRLPPHIQQALDDYMKRGIAPTSFGLLVRK